MRLSASNPDDEALICAAEHFGFKFVDRRGGQCHFTDAAAGGAVAQARLLAPAPALLPFVNRRF
jgi:hypothetical protein